ncbi:MAG: protein-L-isoaspartate(D-aspartate) O-methyltransferase [Thermodesulfobacteriota bacterium]
MKSIRHLLRGASWSILMVAAGAVSVVFAADPRDLQAAFSEKQAERNLLVDSQLRGLGRTTITDSAVLAAMRRVPRHLFIPPAQRSVAYGDFPVPIGHSQTISQPYIVALMTQALDLKHGMKVLEVGTGSGYQAAILAEITPRVFTIEIIEPLYEFAKNNLKKLAYRDVTVRLGDGYFGLKEFAPFDRIVVTCAALHIPPPLFEQLSPGGRMVIPVGGRFETQRLLLVEKDTDGKRRSRTLELVRFVPLIGGEPSEK